MNRTVVSQSSVSVLPDIMANQNKQIRLQDLNDDILFELLEYIPSKGQERLHEAANDCMKETIELYWKTEVKHLEISEDGEDVREIEKWVERCPNIRSLDYEVDYEMIKASFELIAAGLEKLESLRVHTIDISWILVQFV